MIAQRLAPVGTPRHERLFNLAKSLDRFDDCNPLMWFVVWTLYTAGISAHAGSIDRFTFWDFSRWLPGLSGLTIWTLIYVIFLRSKDWFNFPKLTPDIKLIVPQLVVAELIFLSGWFFPSLQGLWISITYLLSYTAIALVFTIPIVTDQESGKKRIPDPQFRLRIVISGAILLIISMVLGIMRDDPVLSTAAVVALPFYIVAFFDNHVRHVQRLRFYPAFIFAGFIASREAWFFVAAITLFYLLRHFYYFRLGIIHPSFGVDHDDPPV
ncbi:MAG: hypothetical protein GXO90_09225 [FCB group bacterium]|nr:hypothetical protein [FCB group bacterium]